MTALGPQSLPHLQKGTQATERPGALGARGTMAAMEAPLGKTAPCPVYLHLRIRVTENRRDEFLSFLKEAVPFYEAPGGIRFRLLTNSTDPERFIEEIEYADEHAYQSDDERVRFDPAMKQMLERWRSLLAEAPVIEVYRIAPTHARDQGRASAQSALN